MHLEKRRNQRINLEAPVNIHFATGEDVEAKCFDFSDTGVFVELEESERNKLPIGSIVRVQFQGLNYTPPIMTAEVVRRTHDGIGLILLDTYQKAKTSEE